MPVKVYDGTNWVTVAGDGAAGAPGTNGTNGIDASPFAAGKNSVLNSNFSVWQRGTSFALANTSSNYSADRWAAISATTGTATRQTTSDTTNLPFIQYCARAQRTAAQTGTSAIGLYQFFESVNAIPLAGKTVVLSFYARAGANFSAASSVLGANLYTGTGTDQNPFAVSYTGSANPVTGSATLTTTWQRFTYSGTLAATATELYLSFAYTPVGTAGAADYFEITGVQLEAANTASPYAPNGATYQAELAACQRYLPVITASTGTFTLAGYSSSTTRSYFTYVFPVTPRTSPTGFTVSSASHFNVFNGSLTSGAATAVTFDTGSLNQALFYTTTTAGTPTLTAGQGSLIQSSSASALILFTGCEL